jgi:hypothetical protein
MRTPSVIAAVLIALVSCAIGVGGYPFGESGTLSNAFAQEETPQGPTATPSEGGSEAAGSEDDDSSVSPTWAAVVLAAFAGTAVFAALLFLYVRRTLAAGGT